MANPKFTQDFYYEFQKDPKSFCQKYGISISDAEFFKKDYSKMSYSDFKDYIKKSRYSNYFDLS